MAKLSIPQVEPGGSLDLNAFGVRYRNELTSLVDEAGGVLLKGFSPVSPSSFSAFLDTLRYKRMDYLNRSTPRVAVAGGIMTATEYPASEEIIPHSEASYHSVWPLRIAFYCVKPAENGGATTIANLQQVSESIPAGLLKRFDELGVCYIRHYWPGFDLSWQETFQTSSRVDVERFCQEHEIGFEWLDTNVLKTTQRRPATLLNAKIAKTLFFNQAHLFHRSAMGSEIGAGLELLFGAQRSPRHATYGDGSEIDASDLEFITRIMKRESEPVNWQEGNLLILDNTRYAHGRLPFLGSRHVLAALLDPSKAEDYSHPKE